MNFVEKEVEAKESTKIQRRCEECTEKLSLYQCPGCSIRTCSLQCCQAHKRRTKCNGKRKRGAYLPLCRMNDTTLRSDYFFMEEVLDIIPRAQKVSKLAEEGKSHANHGNQISGSENGKSISSINKKAKRLVQQAQRRGITLQVMPPIMERHRNNSSWYCSSRDLITWKVEVIIVPGKDTYSFDLSEQDTEILRHISKVVKDKHGKDSVMASIAALDSYQLLIKRLPSSANNPRYIRVKNNQCLKTVLEGLTIVEYPTIYCVRNTNMSEFPIGTDEIIEKVSDTIQSRENAGIKA